MKIETEEEYKTFLKEVEEMFYKTFLKEVEEMFDVVEHLEEKDQIRFKELCDAIEKYEDIHYPIPEPDKEPENIDDMDEELDSLDTKL